MKISSFLTAIFLPFLSQEPPPSYQFTADIDQAPLADTSSYAFERAAWEYAHVGEYEKAIWAFDQIAEGYPTLSDEQKARFLSFQPTPAYNFIMHQAEQEKIIMINEAHHQPRHRVFTTSLLRGLYQKGYRFLGLEALGYEDSLLNERKYPLLTSGYYVGEPQLGNLVREALAIGYEVFPYETSDFSNGKEREIQQARNIQQWVEAHPDGKFLIHCGFDHINESDVPSWGKAMAGRVKEYTNIDPFTINQEILTERYLREKENPFFQLVDTLSEPSVFVKGDGSLFRGNEGDNRYDVRLFHPRTTYVNGRPRWLLMNEQRKIYMIDPKKITIDYPVLVKAYRPGEEDKAVPIDVIEIGSYSDQKALVLPEGGYTLELHNKGGDTLQLKATVGQ